MQPVVMAGPSFAHMGLAQPSASQMPAPAAGAVQVQIPAGVAPGQLLTVNVNGQTVQVAVPPGAYAGQMITAHRGVAFRS